MDSWFVAIAIGSSLAVAACSSDSSPTRDGGQIGGAGGQAGAAQGVEGSGGAGVIDGPVAPAAQGAASIHVGPPISAGNSCPAVPHWTNAPFLATSATTQQVTFDQKGPDPGGDGPESVDGVDGARVTCSVKPNGTKFDVAATIVAPVPGKQPNVITVHATLGPNDNAASGTMSVSDDQTLSVFSSNSCNFTTRPTTGGVSGVSAGKVWASVTCTNAVDINNAVPNSACDFAPPGVFVFENCAQE